MTLLRGLLASCLTFYAVVVQAQDELPTLAGTTSGRGYVQHFKPNVKPRLTIPMVDDGVQLDGILDDALWRHAAKAVDFSETFPGDQSEPPIGIEVRLAYDNDNLYVAFLIEDDPDAIRSSLSSRDDIWQDDYVGIILDPYATNAWSYFIASNPIGIQGDTRIVNGGEEDLGFDVLYDSEGRLTETGYTVEMAIPFRSLRFPTREIQSWSANFWITHPRDSRRTYSWAAISRDNPCWQCQFGRLEGIQGVRRHEGVELLPSIVGSQSGMVDDDEDPSSAFDNEAVSFEPSLGLKYAFSSNLIADATLNPDFSQVEADVAQVDVNTTFALFFPERRPFFQEGAELYQTYIQTVYTRSINNPSVATKLTGRFDRANLAYLGAIDTDTPIILPFDEQSEIVDAGRSYTNVGRYKRNFGDGSFIGGLFIDRRYEAGGSGTTGGLDGAFRFLNNYQFEWQFVFSQTDEPNDTTITEDVDEITFDGGRHTSTFDGESYSGYATHASLERDSRFWSFDLNYWGTSPSFRADAGFVFRSNIHRLVGWSGLDFRPAWSLVDRITPWVHGGYEWNFDGLRKEEYVVLGFNGAFKMQTQAGAELLVQGNERFKGTDFRGMTRLSFWVDSNFSDPVKLGSEIAVGESIARSEDIPVLGDGFDLGVWGQFKPTDRLRIEPRLNFSRLVAQETGETVFNGYIGRARFNYQFTKRLLVRLVAQYDEFDDQLEIDPLLTYRVNPFTAFFVGSTHDYTDYDEDRRGFKKTNRQFFFKVQYLVRT